MQLRITDGTTTVDMAGATTGIAGATYFPAPPSGANAVSVTETAELVGNGTAAQMRAAVNSIERLLEDARRRKRLNTGARVFLEYKPVTGDALYRSEVYDGRVTWSEEPGARRLNDTTAVGKFALLVERAPWWEGAETELELAATAQAAATGGRSITNDGISNWVSIAAAQVTGTLPAPARVQLQNTLGSAVFYRDFHLGLNAFSAQGTFGHLLQGETREDGYGTVTAGAGTSGGQYVRLALTTTGSYGVAWLLPAAMMVGGGRWFRLVMRLAASAPTGTILRPSVWDTSGTNRLWTGQEIVLESGVSLHDLGAIPIPPGAYDTTYGRVMLKFWTELQSGTANLDIDYIAVVPTDSYRYAKQIGNTVPDDAFLEVDDIEGKAYTLESTTKYPVVVTRGNPFMLYPNVAQRMIVVEGTATGTSPIDHTFTVRMWYRPRRATV